MTHRTTDLSRRTFNRLALAGLGAAVTSKAFASGFQFQEAPALAELAKQGKLPPLAERLPKSPLIADFARSGRKTGKYGGEARTLAARARDLRYISVNAYTRLVGFNDKLQLEPDLLLGFENVDERIFTFTLREGHRWSDGTPFTTADFRYFWEDIALNKELNPTGPPEVMIVDGKLPKVEFLDELTVRYSWDKPNPRFLPVAGAAARAHALLTGQLPEAVPPQVPRQGRTRPACGQGEAQVLGRPAQPHGRRLRERQSGDADAQRLARRDRSRRQRASSSSATPISTASTRRGGSFPTSTGSWSTSPRRASSRPRRMPARWTCSRAAFR